MNDLALSIDDARLYVSAGQKPPRFDILDPGSLVFGSSLPGTAGSNNLETSWNGMLAAGAAASGLVAGNIWVYDAAGVERGRFDSARARSRPMR